MCRIPLGIADVRMERQRRVHDRNIRLILVRAVPAVFLQALLALFGPGDVELAQCPVHSRTADALHPIRLQGPVALGHQIPAVDQDLVHFHRREGGLEPGVVRVCAIRGVGHLQHDGAVKVSGCGILSVAAKEDGLLGVIALDEGRWRRDFREWQAVPTGLDECVVDVGAVVPAVGSGIFVIVPGYAAKRPDGQYCIQY